MAMIQALGFFFGHGGGNFISRKLGSKEIEPANQMGSIAFIIAFMAGILVAVLGIVFLEPLSIMLGSTPTILPYTKAYLRLTLWGAPFMMTSLVLNNMLRYQGHAMYGMIGMVAGAVINIGLDPLFIFTFNMGVAGAALATVVSQFISFVILLYLNEISGGIKIRLNNFKPNLFFLHEIFKGGIPSLLRQGLASIAVVFLNKAAGLHGDVAIAAISIVFRVMIFSFSFLIGFGQGFQPVCGFNYGAKIYDRVKEAFKFCNITALIFLTVSAALLAIFAPQIITIFRSEDAEVIAIGTRALRYQTIFMPLGGFIVLSSMLFQTMGRATKASIVASARQGIFFIPLVLILPRLFGLEGLMLTQPIADLLTFITAVPLTVGVVRELSS